MKLATLPRKFKRIMFLLAKKGLEYTYNYIYFSLLFGTKNALLIKFLYWLAPYPSYIEIEVTTRCNLKCIICERTYWSEANKDMSFDEFKMIVDQFPRLKWIGLTGIGESFLNKDFMKMLEYVKSKNIFVELYDNFFLIDKSKAQGLVKMGIDKFFISLDAATKETYEKLRPGSDFNRVIENLKNFFEAKKEAGAHFPEVAFHFIANSLNIHEIPQYIDLVRSITQEKDTIVQISRMLHSFKEVESLFAEIPNDVIAAAEKKAKNLGIHLVWNADVASDKPEIKKCTEWTMPFIFVTGHVVPCCAGNEAGHRLMQKETALGNIFEKSFKDIWRDFPYKNLRKMLKQNKVPPACVNCCLYKIKNS